MSSVILGLFNPKSPTNVGAVLRAAGCYRANEVRYVGERYDKAARFHTDTQGAGKAIPFKRVENIEEQICENTKIVCVELVEGAIPLPEFKHPEKALYVFGPEDNSIPQKVVSKADHVVYVPTVGCMNLAATVNVLLYDRLAKQSIREQGDELIKKSRDNKNTLKVKRRV